ECDIKENVEPDKLVAQAMEVVHHGATPTANGRLLNSSITSSVRAARLPLIRTRSPGSAILAKISAASLADVTALVFSKPARSAARTIAAATLPIAIR